MKKMLNTIQYYHWGSKDALTNLYGISNPNNQPMAELWMGAYPQGGSHIINEQGNLVSLSDFIAQDPVTILGDKVAKQFGTLPFLFKILCIDRPLSVQVHPNIYTACSGFFKENKASIAIDSPNRHYKDPNHKPEFVFALTHFKAMNGFRTLSSIVSLLTFVSNAHPSIAIFLACPDEKNLLNLLGDLLTMTGKQKSLALYTLTSIVSRQHNEPWESVSMLSSIYPNDNGLFFPLLLNIITLQPGQAMFLPSQTPHAYLKGIAMEVSANSNNVLRAGLTCKHTNISEFMANIMLIFKPENTLLSMPISYKNTLFFPIQIEDFSFSIHTLTLSPYQLKKNSAAILFCVDGEAVVNNRDQKLVLKPGESVFITSSESSVFISGTGYVAHVDNSL